MGIFNVEDIAAVVAAIIIIVYRPSVYCITARYTHSSALRASAVYRIAVSRSTDCFCPRPVATMTTRASGTTRIAPPGCPCLLQIVVGAIAPIVAIVVSGDTCPAVYLACGG